MGDGPLADLRVIELAGRGPAPFGAMMLADMGADVIRVERPTSADRNFVGPTLRRGRRSICLDLKHAEAPLLLGAMAEVADVVIEPFRPGVAERLGIGPADLHRRNPGLVYVRMTGWGQDGPLASRGGRDINYIALAGALDPLGREGHPPTPPLNLVGDFGGGGMLMAFGVMTALWERQRSGRGQVVDTAMIDGAALMMTMFHELRAAGDWSDHRGSNYLDSGAPFYDAYRCADEKCVALGAIDPRAYARVLEILGINPAYARLQHDRSTWLTVKTAIQAAFRRRTRDEWMIVFDPEDVCVTPVLSLDEVTNHPHHKSRGTFTEVDGVRQPSPAPRFSRTPAPAPRPTPAPGEGMTDVLVNWLGLDARHVDDYRRRGFLG